MRADHCGETLERTDLVEDEDELLPASVEPLEFAFDGTAPRSDRVPRVQHLDDDVAHLEDFAQTLGVQLETRVLNLRLAFVLVLVVVEHGILARLGVGGEGGREGSGRREGGALLIRGLGGLSSLELFLLDLLEPFCVSSLGRLSEITSGCTHASLFGLGLCEQLVLEREAVWDPELLWLVCSRAQESACVSARSFPVS